MAASKAILKLGPQATPALEEALNRSPPVEAERRIREVLQKLRQPLDSATLRQVRAVQALALAGTPAARKLVERWANGAAGEPLTDAARAAAR